MYCTKQLSRNSILLQLIENISNQTRTTTVSVTTVECLALMSCFFPRATAQQIIVLFALTQEEPYQTSAMQGTEWAAQVW